MNPALWPALRELIRAEARLAALEDRAHDRPGGRHYEAEREELKTLRAQVTRMETAVREGLEFAQCTKENGNG